MQVTAAAAAENARPRTHCGLLRAAGADEVLDADDRAGPPGAGVTARERAGSCRLCMKLMLRLENEERARVKAQEQLVKLQMENLRLRGLRQSSSSEAAGHADALPPAEEPGTAAAALSPAPAGAVATAGTGGTGAVASPDESLDDAGRLLERYRREVEMLRERLRRQSELEADFVEQRRQQKAEHVAAIQEWESQVAGLVCEVQDLEARNLQLEGSLRALAPASAMSSTTASAREAASGASSEAATTHGGLDDAAAPVVDGVT